MNIHKLRKCLELAEELVKVSGGDFCKDERRYIMNELVDREWELYEQTKEKVGYRKANTCSH